MFFTMESKRTESPFDEATHTAVIHHIQHDDIVLDINAGDLSLARRMTNTAQHVYVWEHQAEIVETEIENLTICYPDSQFDSFPSDITVAVLLSRYCQHFARYAKKLRTVGCRYLITNARWGSGLEVINLQTYRQLYSAIPVGWFACWCGNAGFKADSAEQLMKVRETAVHEVIFCPNCRYNEL